MSVTPQNQQYWISNVSGARTLQIQAIEGWRFMSIKNSASSTDDITVVGNTSVRLGGILPTSMTISPDESFTIGGSDNQNNPQIDDVTITIPSGVTAKIIAVRWQQTNV